MRLGKGMATTGGWMTRRARALAALRRFHALSETGPRRVHACAGDGSGARVGKRSGFHLPRPAAFSIMTIRVLTGEEEALYSAYGIVSGFHDVDGIAGDLGGGSLELVDISGKQIGKALRCAGRLAAFRTIGRRAGKGARHCPQACEGRRPAEEGQRARFSTPWAAPGAILPSCTWKSAITRCT